MRDEASSKARAHIHSLVMGAKQLPQSPPFQAMLFAFGVWGSECTQFQLEIKGLDPKVLESKPDSGALWKTRKKERKARSGFFSDLERLPNSPLPMPMEGFLKTSWAIFVPGIKPTE